MKTGFVAVLGRANVGKSSIVNALVGEKVSIVSPKPQTTRDRILGIRTDADCQIVFVDTPGVHEPRTKLGDYMMTAVDAASRDTDLLLIVVDASHGLERQDMELIRAYAARNIPMLLAYNKTDLATADSVLAQLDKLNAPENRMYFESVVPLSCRTGKNLDVLLAEIERRLPEGEPLFPADEYTDKSLRYLVAETVREKILLLLRDEVPHGVQVLSERFEQTPDAMEIDVVIVVEKPSHKPIVIGKGGDTIKRIGMSARRELENTYGCKVVLRTFVKVVEDWRNKPAYLSDFGFDPKTLTEP